MHRRSGTEAISRSRHRSIVAGASITTASQIASAIAGGITAVVIARVLGPSGTGVYNVVVATVAILTVIFAVGLDIGTTYFVGGRRWNSGNAARQLQLAALSLGLLALSIGWGAAVVLHDHLFAGINTETLLIGLAAIPLSLSWLYGSALRLAQERYESSALAAVSQALLTLALVALLAPASGVHGAVVAFTVANAFTATWVAVLAVADVREEASRWVQRMIPELAVAIRFGVKVNLAAVLALLNRRADLLILNAYASHASVGQYGVALSLTELQTLLPYSLARVLVPRLSSLSTEDAPAERSFVLVKSVRHGIVISVLSGFGMAVSLLLVPFVFGRAFDASVRLGWILVPGAAAYGLATIFSAILVGSGRPGFVLRAAVIVTPATFVLYFALIPTFGATGAAIASTISYCSTLVVCWLYFRRVATSRLRILLPGRDEIADYRALLVLARLRLRAAVGS
jgi:stage V sporulation protein B